MLKKTVVVIAVFLAAYFLPFDSERLQKSILEGFFLLHDYAREHVLLCLIPAFLIAGAISNFVSQGAVLRHLGAKANRVKAYGVAAVSGSILAVCSCTILPLFTGIYKRGAGLGPATAFLYSGPAINVLAIILSARVLGPDLGLARAFGAILFSVVIGLIMAWLFRHEEVDREAGVKGLYLGDEGGTRTLMQTGLTLAAMIGVLVFVNWGRDPGTPGGLWNAIHGAKYVISSIFLGALVFMLVRWYSPDERVLWLRSSGDFALQILPLLFGGVLAAGFLVGRPGAEGLIPSDVISSLVGGNSLRANFFAALAGALTYFATLTEVPIVQGLLGSGMGRGPALALLLSGPALSFPSMLVIHSVLGTRKTLVFVALVVALSTVAGMLFGALTA